ncbi:M15 family metallopeptidase [Propionibacteriaceae bacterium G1746]
MTITANADAGCAPGERLTLWWADSQGLRWRPALTAEAGVDCRLALPLASGLRVGHYRFAVTTGDAPGPAERVSIIDAHPAAFVLSGPTRTTLTGQPTLTVDAGPHASGLPVVVLTGSGSNLREAGRGSLDERGRFSFAYRLNVGVIGTVTLQARISDGAGYAADSNLHVVLREGFGGRIRATTAADVSSLYRAGCPVGPSGLATIEMYHWDYQGRVQPGVMIVRKDLAPKVMAAFERAFAQGWPVQSMKSLNLWNGDDLRIMAAGNAGAFNCRHVVGNPYAQSPHSYGIAVDVNQRENPYRAPNGVWYPIATYATYRPATVKGLFTGQSPLVVAMNQQGFRWFSGWDWHHFQP